MRLLTAIKKYIMKHKSKTAIIGLVLLFLFSPLGAYCRSLIIMAPYSAYEKSQSILVSDDIELKMPGGNTTLKKDWYPFVITFNDDYGLSYILERDVRLTILYNFGAFHLGKGASTFYDESSDYLNAFYGAYIVKDEGRPFGYDEEGKLDHNALEIVPKHDMKNLVLYSIGKEDGVFDAIVIDEYKVDSFLGYEDWDVLETSVKTNSPMHHFKKNHMAYIQYGKPWRDHELTEDFREMCLKGKAYVKHFEEKDVTIVFYVLAGSDELIDYTDENFFQKSRLDLHLE